MTRADLLAFLRSCRYAVESSTHSNGTPQSAVVGVAVSDDFEIVFDTVNTSRKAQNLSQRGGIAFAFGDLGLHQGRTVQLEGVADQPEGAERDRLTALYYTVFPDGRERLSWPGLIYLRATPHWLRYSDFDRDPPQILEFDRAALKALE